MYFSAVHSRPIIAYTMVPYIIAWANIYGISMTACARISKIRTRWEEVKLNIVVM